MAQKVKKIKARTVGYENVEYFLIKYEKTKNDTLVNEIVDNNGKIYYSVKQTISSENMLVDVIANML